MTAHQEVPSKQQVLIHELQHLELIACHLQISTLKLKLDKEDKKGVTTIKDPELSLDKEMLNK